jgi:NAD(P)-dependent dehydrogenase (short-subunit alcohol dehydrogenase family)
MPGSQIFTTPSGPAPGVRSKQEQLDFFADASPLQRLGTPADIAALVAFLVSPAGHWINGQTIRANGGLH